MYEHAPAVDYILYQIGPAFLSVSDLSTTDMRYAHPVLSLRVCLSL